MARILLAVTNDLAADQRMDRICTTLSQAGHEVCLIGRRLPDSPEIAPRAYATRRMRLLFTRGKLFYFEYNLLLFRYLLFAQADLLVANDLDTLPGCWLAAVIRRKPLVYDSHEYFTELPELLHRPLTRSVWLQIERWIFPRLRHVYTVSGSIAAAYEARYGVKVQVIRNLPLAANPSAAVFSREKNLLYQGSLNVGRGLELMVETLVELPDYQLIIAGRGVMEEPLHRLAQTLQVADRVIFTGFLSPEALRQLTPTARIGLSLEEDLGENYRYALPNKLFDYVQARVPVIVSDLPEMKALCTEFQLGLVLDASQRTAKGLAALVRKLDADAESYQCYVDHCAEAARSLTWEQEEKPLLALYKEALAQ